MSSHSAQAALIDGPDRFDFAEIRIAVLDAMTPDQVDALPYGVVGLASDGTTEIYNATESKLAGIPSSIVLGWSYFAETAQCMNNFMVAQRFEDEPEIDEVIDYVLTLRMRPTPVRLRLIKAGSCARRYLLIQR
ncbi:phosphonate transporter [Lichenibacterium minor]|uniref:Phosphonate transporter n=1 Tax=Lichenibacterium minor TaxID=2316528 RepID=A0A4Q2U029_9HYPH|nr:phosphonate transporter [Lichenibacterium minor]RYC29759.1 phosphonate transporter [Lichenibacterium minor]